MIRNLIELARELADAALAALLPRAVETCPAWCPCRVELEPAEQPAERTPPPHCPDCNAYGWHVRGCPQAELVAQAVDAL